MRPPARLRHRSPNHSHVACSTPIRSAMSADPNTRLIHALGEPHVSHCGPDTHCAPCALGGTVARKSSHRLTHRLSPVPTHAQELLCRRWIEARLDIAFDAARPLVDSLGDCAALCRLLGKTPEPVPTYPASPYAILERRYSCFARAARAQNIPLGEDFFELDDLVFRRNVPRVLRAVAAIARATDPDNFHEIALEIPGARVNWTAADEPDEEWGEDDMELVNGLVERYQCALGNQECLRVLVTGSQGGGKSATVNRIMGRALVPETHALSIVLEDEAFLEHECAHLKMNRRFMAENWPCQAYETGISLASDKVCKTHTKVRGTVIDVTEIPSMEQPIESVSESGIMISGCLGTYEEILDALQGETIDFVLLVERLDDFESSSFRGSYRTLHKIYGERVWTRTLVVLTHGESLPPDGISYDMWVGNRTHEVQKAVQRVSGNEKAEVTVVITENSSHCAKNDQGVCVLPNGSELVQAFLSAFDTLLDTSAAATGSSPLRAVPVRRWWENYVLLGMVGIILSQL